MQLKLRSMSSRFSFKWRWNFGRFTSFACQGAPANGTREEFFGDAVVGFTCALIFSVIVAQCVRGGGGTVFISPLKQERSIPRRGAANALCTPIPACCAGEGQSLNFP